MARAAQACARGCTDKPRAPVAGAPQRRRAQCLVCDGRTERVRAQGRALSRAPAGVEPCWVSAGMGSAVGRRTGTGWLAGNGRSCCLSVRGAAGSVRRFSQGRAARLERLRRATGRYPGSRRAPRRVAHCQPRSPFARAGEGWGNSQPCSSVVAASGAPGTRHMTRARSLPRNLCSDWVRASFLVPRAKRAAGETRQRGAPASSDAGIASGNRSPLARGAVLALRTFVHGACWLSGVWRLLRHAACWYGTFGTCPLLCSRRRRRWAASSSGDGE